MLAQWVTWLSKFVEDQSNKITFHWYQFSELTLEQLYAALKLRAEVFVVEQNCVYLDVDGKDQQAIHLLGTENNQLIAYLRLFPPTTAQNYITVGRVVTAKKIRGKGQAMKMMRELARYCKNHYPNVSIEGSAQLYLKKFYERLGYQICGEIYDEDGIPHIRMKRDL